MAEQLGSSWNLQGGGEQKKNHFAFHVFFFLNSLKYFSAAAVLTAPPALRGYTHGVSWLQAAGCGTSRVGQTSCSVHILHTSPSTELNHRTLANVRSVLFFLFSQLTRRQEPGELHRQSPQRAVGGVGPHGAHVAVGGADQQPKHAQTVKVVPGVEGHDAVLDGQVRHLAGGLGPEDGPAVLQDDGAAAEGHGAGQEEAEDRWALHDCGRDGVESLDSGLRAEKLEGSFMGNPKHVRRVISKCLSGI